MLSAVLLTLMRVLKLKTLSNPLIFSVKKSNSNEYSCPLKVFKSFTAKVKARAPSWDLRGRGNVCHHLYCSGVIIIRILILLLFFFFFLSISPFYFFRNEMVKWFVLSHLKSKHILGNENLAKIRRIGGKSRQ